MNEVLAEYLRPGDRILIAQATGEPLGLVDDLLDMMPGLPGVNVFCGYSLNQRWAEPLPEVLCLRGYCGLGTMGHAIASGRAGVIPFAMSQLSAALAQGKLPVDIVLLQTTPADSDGFYNLGPAADYAWEAAKRARTVIVEVNSAIPVVRNACRLHESEIVVGRISDTPLPIVAREPIGDTQRKIARHVVRHVPDGATVQLGIGKLSAAIAEALCDRRGLRLRCGLIGDWFEELRAAGALDQSENENCLASLALGSLAFYARLPTSPLGFALAREIAMPIAGSPYMAINSAIEVDVRGQANAEYLGDRYVGAASGQPDYFRAARRSDGGLAILALPAANERGTISRIVPHLREGYVTTAQSDIDLVVTEYGVADLRATDLDARRARLAAIAHPALLQA